MTKKYEGSDQVSLDLLKRMKESGIESAFDRYDPQQSYTKLVKQLISNNVLVVQTGCAAAECAREGMMVPEYWRACGTEIERGM